MRRALPSLHPSRSARLVESSPSSGSRHSESLALGCCLDVCFVAGFRPLVQRADRFACHASIIGGIDSRGARPTSRVALSASRRHRVAFGGQRSCRVAPCYEHAGAWLLEWRWWSHASLSWRGGAPSDACLSRFLGRVYAFHSRGCWTCASSAARTSCSASRRLARASRRVCSRGYRRRTFSAPADADSRVGAFSASHRFGQQHLCWPRHARLRASSDRGSAFCNRAVLHRSLRRVSRGCDG